MKAARWLVLVTGLAVAVSALATAAPSFRYARPVQPGAAGPNRLAVDVGLLAGARPLRFDAAGQLLDGLDDLRLLRADGSEVPHLIVPAPAPVLEWRGARVEPILPSDEESGFEVALDDVVRIDRLRLSGLPSPFLKRARLEGSGDRVRWIMLAAERTVFDLPVERLHGTEIDFAPEAVRYLRLTWDDRSSARVPAPAAASVRLAVAPVPESVLVPLAFERRTSEPGVSRFVVRLPGRGLPVRALEVDCGGAYLRRNARVTEPQLAGDTVAPRELGSSLLSRVERENLVASDLRIGIAAPRELEIELVVDDGDNPPLELRAVHAELPALPWIYFESPDGAALTAKFGAAGLGAPRYDLEAARGALHEADAAAASWGERVALPEVPEAPSGTSENMPPAGAAIDLGIFRYRRALRPGPAGLTALRLDAAALAHSDRLADLRLVDEASRQIPYVVEHVGAPQLVELEPPVLEPASAPSPGMPRETIYRIDLPYAHLPDARLVLETTGRVFQRQLVIRVERPAVDARSAPRMDVVGTMSWHHADPERPAPAVTIYLPSFELTRLFLVVDDGDNSPLPLSAARLLLPADRIRFLRPSDGALVLAYGAPGLVAPRYDLTLLAPRILGAPAHEIDALPEEGGEAAVTGRPASEAVSRWVFWGVLAVALVVLAVILARLLRIDEAGKAA